MIFDENEPTKMNSEEVLAKVLPIAESLNWLVNRGGTAVKPYKKPELIGLDREEVLCTKYAKRISIYK